MALTFDHIHSGYDTFMKVVGLYRIDQLKELLQLKGNESLLDVGGGTGHIVSFLINNLKDATIIDESQQMLSHLSNNDKITSIVGDATQLPFKDQSFNRIIMCDVLHHLKDQTKVLAEIKRVLTDDGMFVMYDFDKDAMLVKILVCLEKIFFKNVLFHNAASCENLLITAGFKIKNFIKGNIYYVVCTK